jgi:hypothetical protein
MAPKKMLLTAKIFPKCNFFIQSNFDLKNKKVFLNGGSELVAQIMNFGETKKFHFDYSNRFHLFPQKFIRRLHTFFIFVLVSPINTS